MQNVQIFNKIAIVFFVWDTQKNENSNYITNNQLVILLLGECGENRKYTIPETGRFRGLLLSFVTNKNYSFIFFQSLLAATDSSTLSNFLSSSGAP